MELKYKEVQSFADVLKNTKFNMLQIGAFTLQAENFVDSLIQYNNEDFELLKKTHDYTFQIMEGKLELSLQLYENNRNHYRLFAYTKFENKSGMVFSINLTTEKESENIIFLTQKIKFSDRFSGDEVLAKAYRQQKQYIFNQYLRKLGFDITDNNDVVLGIFDPISKEFVNTNPQQFLNDFILISLIKGHFQGNKGFQLEILPSFKLRNDYVNLQGLEEVTSRPIRVSNEKRRRNIPLGIRYKVLRRDKCKCVACGRSPEDGIKLHIDHKIPYSLGGLTEISNLQTLCNECNLGKSNKFID